VPTPNSLRTPAIVILLACASTGVALPLYREDVRSLGGTSVSYLAGWPTAVGVKATPILWLLPALALSASLLVLKGQRRPAAWLLGLLAALTAVPLLGASIAPGPAFLPIAAVILLAWILLITEKARG
jgi:hypothetical protein